MPNYHDWEIIKPLGQGGQGQVSLVRHPARVEDRRKARKEISSSLRNMETDSRAGEQFLEGIARYIRPDRTNELGALKQFIVPTTAQHRDGIVARFRSEIHTLEKFQDTPGILKIVDHDIKEHWIITTYYGGGSLSRCQDLFRGNPQSALHALRPIVVALATLHAENIVHRDIKPQNIFVDDTNQLVLGDFGIVFLEPDNRPTEILERVGSRDWMPPWAHIGMRVDDVKPTFDVFSLGKVLWSMIAARPMLPYWYHRRPPYDLTKIFPDNPSMHAINLILDSCIVENEADCLTARV